MSRPQGAERLQKFLAQAGVASRRAAEQLIVEGRVRINGRVVKELGTKVDPRHDRVDVDGKRVVAAKPAYYVVHKPRGMVTTMSDPEGRPTIREILQKLPERVVPIGRLDFHTSGVLLCTNDGEMAEALTRPSRGVPKTYVVKVQGLLEDLALQNLRQGVTLDDGYKTKQAEVLVLREEDRNTWLQVTLYEGKNRQIHRMIEAIGHRVMRLARVKFAGIDHEGLRPGEFRTVNGEELADLKKKFLNPYRRAKALAAEQGAAAPAAADSFEVEFEDD